MGYGKNIKRAADAKGISIKRLAMKTGVSAPTLYSAIKRDAGIRYDIAMRVAEYLGISPDLICGHCSFENALDGESKIETFMSRISDDRRKASIESFIRTLMALNEDQFTVAETVLKKIQKMTFSEGIWLLELMDMIQHYAGSAEETADKVSEVENTAGHVTALTE